LKTPIFNEDNENDPLIDHSGIIVHEKLQLSIAGDLSESEVHEGA